ncbi:MAG: hypothetical protein J1F40_01600 [Prevotellaceae bacterium]|nr:hypothetical protein [Prevotellaceae bacterium]
MENKFIKESAAELLEKLCKNGAEKEKEILSVVNKHSLIAAGAGWIPIPFVDIILVVGNIWTMYAAINKVIGISFSDNLLKSIGSGVVANLSSAIISQALLSCLKAIPGIGTVSAGLILTACNYATCVAAGYVYMRALTIIANEDGGIDPSDPDLKKNSSVLLRNKKQKDKRLGMKSRKNTL